MAKKIIKNEETVEFQGKKMTRNEIFSMLESNGVNVLNAGIGNLSLTQIASIGSMLLSQAEKISVLETKVNKKSATKLTMKQATAIVTVASIDDDIVQQLTVSDIINSFEAGKITSLKSNGKRKNKTQAEIDLSVTAFKATIDDSTKNVTKLLKLLQDIDNLIDNDDNVEDNDND